MPVARFQMPDGRVARFEVPEGTSPEQAQSLMEAHFAQQAPSEGMPQQRQAAPTMAPVAAAPEEQSFLSQVGQGIKDVYGATVRGAGSIGATLMTPVDIAARAARESSNPLVRAPLAPTDWFAKQIGLNPEDIFGRTDRRQKMDEFMRDVVGANPESLGYKGGQIFGETLGTGGVGGATANLLARAGLSKVAPAFVNALRTGGFGAGNFIPKVTAGAVTGGATAGLINPEEATTGAGIGAGLPAAGKAVAPVARYLSGKTAEMRAAEITRQAAGPNIAQVRAAANVAPEELTAAQAIAGTESPQLQAIAAKVAERDAARGITPKIRAQQVKNESVLNRLAGGATEAESIGRTKEMSTALRGQTIPILDQSLSSANAITRQLTELEALAPQLSRQAAEEVQNVRRLVNAGNVAEANARLGLIRRNLPVGLTKYTYPSELGKKADEWATQAAKRSLAFGDEARQAAGTAQAMRGAGIEPLTADSLTNKIKSVLTVEQTGNATLRAGVNKVIDDIVEASASNGTVDARALYAIRKNSVGEFVKKLFPGAMDSAQKAEAARIMSEINPIIDKAIEKSGGKGFSDYLKTYSAGQRQIEQTEMSAYLRDLYKTNPKAFVDVVEGNNVKAVQDIFGVGKFDINTEMGESLMRQIRPIADDVMRTERMGKLAKEGAPYAGEIIKANTSGLRIPSLVPKSTLPNAILDEMSSKLGPKVMNELEKGFASGESLNVLLSKVPSEYRNFISKALSRNGLLRAVPYSLSSSNQNALNQPGQQ